MSQTTSYMGLSLYDPYGVDSQVDAITFVNTTTGTGATSSLNVIDVYMSGKATVVVATAAEWATSATVLRANDFGVASDTGIAKRGDGINTWANLDAVDLTYSNFVAAGYTGTQTEFYALLGTISGKQDIMQYATMPVVITGAIVQYTGETTSDYTNGYFYKGGDSAWEEIVYGDPNSVSYDSQDKTPEQKAQARANIGAGTLATKNSVGAADISASAVTNEKLANMAVNTLKGNNTNSETAPSDLSISDVQTMLNMQTKLQYTTMPDAGSSWVDVILQYTGETSESYSCGSWYKCTESSGSYSWVLVALDTKTDGFDPRTTVFSQDGRNITETYGVKRIETEFVSNSTIVQKLYENDVLALTKTITFNADGTINEGVD